MMLTFQNKQHKLPCIPLMKIGMHNLVRQLMFNIMCYNTHIIEKNPIGFPFILLKQELLPHKFNHSTFNNRKYTFMHQI